MNHTSSSHEVSNSSIYIRLSNSFFSPKALFATAVPDPMATPISAFLSAGASLTPSPVYSGHIYIELIIIELITQYRHHHLYSLTIKSVDMYEMRYQEEDTNNPLQIRHISETI